MAQGERGSVCLSREPEGFEVGKSIQHRRSKPAVAVLLSDPGAAPLVTVLLSNHGATPL